MDDRKLEVNVMKSNFSEKYHVSGFIGKSVVIHKIFHHVGGSKTLMWDSDPTFPRWMLDELEGMVDEQIKLLEL